MLQTNADLWNAVDKFAKDHGLSCCGLARTCGLNTTVFNKSKRESKYEQLRWLSTETVAKIINTYKIDIHNFVEKYVPRRYPHKQ